VVEVVELVTVDGGDAAVTAIERLVC